MAVFERVCEVCGESFEAGSPRAMVCGSTCRSRKRRSAQAAPGEPVGEPVPERDSEHDGLVASLIAELESFGVLDTVDGQLALQLARQVTATGATGVSSLSKEFRAVRADALAQGRRPEPDAQPGEPAEVDEVEEARRRRDAKTRAAAAAGS